MNGAPDFVAGFNVWATRRGIADRFFWGLDDAAGSCADIHDNPLVNRVPFGKGYAGVVEYIGIGLSCTGRGDAGRRKRARGSDRGPIEIESGASPVVGGRFGVVLEDVTRKKERRWSDDFCSVHEQQRLLNSGRARLEVIADVVEAVELSVGGCFAPIVDDVVAEVGVDGALKARVAAEVVREQIVVPCDAVTTGDRCIAVLIQV